MLYGQYSSDPCGLGHTTVTAQQPRQPLRDISPAVTTSVGLAWFSDVPGHAMSVMWLLCWCWVHSCGP